MHSQQVAQTGGVRDTLHVVTGKIRERGGQFLQIQHQDRFRFVQCKASRDEVLLQVRRRVVRKDFPLEAVASALK
jgi:hypothetical protein